MNTDSNIYKWTGPTGVHFTEVREPSGIWYRQNAPREVVSALEAAMGTGKRVRIFPGDDKTGREWHEENDVTGHVGRSTGKRPCALLVPAGSMGGQPLMGDHIVRMMVDGREVYRHPGYVEPVFTIETDPHRDKAIAAKYPNMPNPPALVRIDGKEWARFANTKSAERWVAFMKGERATK